MKLVLAIGLFITVVSYSTAYTFYKLAQFNTQVARELSAR